ncbi:MAG: class I adenylate-forming enzyme family protein [Acidiferrobacter sp.]
MLLHDLLENTATQGPEREALVCNGRRLRFSDIAAAAGGIAAGLCAAGVKRGDRVAIFLDNSVEAVIGFYGVLKLGAVAVPINPLTKAGKLAFVLEDAEVAALISDGHLRAVYAPAVGSYPVPCVILSHPTEVDRHRGYREFWELARTPRCDLTPVIDQDLAAILYTSGSTGEPKGVMLTHLNMVSAAQSVCGYLNLKNADRILCCLPLSFDYGLYQVIMAFMVGACVVLERSLAFPAVIVKVLQQEQITVFPGVPTVFALLLSYESLVLEHDVGSIRIITSTAANLPRHHIDRLRRLFPNAAIFSMYGLTECKRVTYLPPEDLDLKPNSVGRGMPNEEVYLVDQDDKRLLPGAVGELVIRGSHVMRGYWRRPEETSRRLRPGPIQGELVLYSGDIFRMDEDGYLYFIGRSDDIIKSRGEKVSPREVENCLYSLPAIAEAAVIGIDDEIVGQAVHAFVVLCKGESLTEHDLVHHCHDHLEAPMVPKHIHIVSALPKTDTGKIRKTSLASLVKEPIYDHEDAVANGVII